MKIFIKFLKGYFCSKTAIWWPEILVDKMNPYINIFSISPSMSNTVVYILMEKNKNKSKNKQTKQKVYLRDRFVLFREQRFSEQRNFWTIRQAEFSIRQLHLISENDPFSCLSLRSIRSIRRMENFIYVPTGRVLILSTGTYVQKCTQ